MTGDVVRPLRTNRVPLSVQVQEYLLGLVRRGSYRPGEQLPSENELSAQLGISRATLREALRNLEQKGVVVRKHGVGTFVTPGYGRQLEGGLERLESVLELATRQGMQIAFTALQVQQEPAAPELADKLQVASGTLLTTIRRAITVDKTAVAYMLDIIPASFLSPADVGETFNGSVLDLLRQKPSPRIAQAVSDIVALSADAFLAEKLDIEPGQAVLLLEELLYDEEGMPVEFSRNYFIPEFFRFHIVRR